MPKELLLKKGEKDISKKEELNEMPNTETATQGDECCIQSPD